MGKQEKRSKAEKAAAVKAEEVIAATVEKVKAKAARRNEVSEEERDTAAQIKERRDLGMAWWQIAFELGLPGSADNVAQGKSGASRARSIYKKVLGDYPKTQRIRKGPDESLASATGSRRRNRHGHEVVRAAAGQSVFPEETSDEDIVAAVLGKKIEWEMWREDLTGKVEFVGTDEQIVHERFRCKIITNADGERILQFREGVGNDLPPEYRGMAGKYRSVYVHRIVKVAGTGRRVETEEVVAARQERTAKKRARRVSRKASAA